MQAIFNFRGNELVDWNNNVLAQFPSLGELQTPWRWINAGTERLGRWLLNSRLILAAGGAIDLRTAPPEVSWVHLLPGTADAQRAVAAQAQPLTRDGTVLVIGDSRNTLGRRLIASRTPGAINVEPADLRDLTDFGLRFNVGAPDAVTQLVGFAGELMTNVGSAEMQRRVASIRAGTARNPATPAEHAVVTFANTPNLNTALNALIQIREQAHVRVYRPDILRSCMNAMQMASDGSCTFQQAAQRERERCRHIGRGTARRSVGSTLLLKGLEADIAVVLNPELMDATHLYVALTRGAQRVVVCSATHTLVVER
ncbi:hypothetical protein GCM10011396_46140 [Undibacterium terreum]|uniref:Uncharacterized protein n=2 Tax=Undibacterium terreum TaxID=1224302 RepID=A0A916XPX3_9BURK|nr:hypothetical protein GCM10011396_46140 [Undibacterium terreum]